MPLSHTSLPTDHVTGDPQHADGHNATNTSINSLATYVAGLPEDADVTAAVAAHEADTTNVHGITDTSALETTAGSTAKVAAHVAASDPHGDRAYANTLNTAMDARVDALEAAPSSNDPGPLEGMTIYAYGHSYTATADNNTGEGAAGQWVARLADRKSMTLTNRAGSGGLLIASGACVVRNALSGSIAWVPNTRGLVTLCCTVNDVSAYGTDAASLRSYGHALRAFLAATRAKARAAAATSAWVYSAGWTSSATSAITATNRFQTTTPGSYAEVNITGSACDLLLTLRAAGNGVYTVTSDGTTVATVTAMDATMGVDYTPAIIPLSGLGSGTHTIRITLTSGTWLGVDGLFIPSETPPRVAVVSEGAVTAVGYSSLVGTWRPVVAAVVAEYPHAVHVVPTGWDSSTMLREDGLHPNDYGASFLATRTLDELDALGWTNGLNLLGTLPSYSPPSAPSTPAGGQSGGSSGGSSLPTVTTGTLFAQFDAGTLGLSDGASVTTWAKTDGTLTGDLASSGTAPTFQTAELNGLPAVRFVGTGFMSTVTDDTLSHPFTRFVVCRSAAGEPSTSGTCVVDSDVSPYTNLFLDTGSQYFGFYAGTAVGSTSPMTFTDPHIVEVVHNSPASQVIVDGVAGTAGSAGTNGMQGVRVGNDNGGTSGYKGDVFEVVLYSGALNSTDRTAVRQYLGIKYGITVT